MPVIESFTPGSGATAATVTILGRNLGGSNAIVQFNGANTVSSGTDSQLIAIVPTEATTGKITVKVNDLIATSTTDFTVLLPPPTITLFEPSSGTVGTTVIITGTNFSTGPAGNVVKFNSVTAEITEATVTQLTVVVPPSATTEKISVTTNGHTVLSVGNFTVIPSTGIASFSPTQGLAGTEVTITGASFSSTASENTVKFNNVTAMILSSSATSLIVVVPNTATTGKITVTTNGSTATTSDDFVVLTPPVGLTSYAPQYGVPGTTVTINGSNFIFPASANTVTFNGSPASVISGTETTLLVTVPANAISGIIKVTTPGGDSGNIGNYFEVLNDFPRNGLVAFFPFNGEGEDKATHDPARSFTMAAANSPTFTTDRFGNPSQALDFDGSQYALNSNDLVPDRPWTISFFMKYQVLTANEGLFSAMVDGKGFEAHFNERWLMQSEPNPNAPWAIDISGDINGPTSDGDYLLVDPYRMLIGYLNKTSPGSAWVNVTIIYDGSWCDLYLDGSNWNNTNVTVSMPEVTEFIFGSSKGFNFTGQLDDLIIYDRAVTYSEALQLKNQTATKYNTGY